MITCDLSLHAFFLRKFLIPKKLFAEVLGFFAGLMFACHMSWVTWLGTYHVSHNHYNIDICLSNLFFIFLFSSSFFGACWWKVCCQHGLPRIYPNDSQILTYKKVSHFLTPSKSWIKFFMTHLRIDICQYFGESKNAILATLYCFHA